MSDNCIFCKIIKGEMPSYKIYEDEHTLAFLDISKDVDGHTLVIPKTHAVNVLDITEENYLNVVKTVKKVAEHYVNNCGYEGVNILNASDASAGQSVFHLHFHLFPRCSGDNANLWPKNAVATKSLEEMQQVLAFR